MEPGKKSVGVSGATSGIEKTLLICKIVMAAMTNMANTNILCSLAGTCWMENKEKKSQASNKSSIACQLSHLGKN